MVGVSSGDRVSATIQGLGSVSVSFDAVESGRRREP
jgi:hypothetical protein